MSFEHGQYIVLHSEIYLLFNSTSAKHVVDFRSDWALSWGRPMSRFASLQGLICDANPQGVAQS
ncbi:hypothetical protein ACQKMI_24630 [Lysinibacillus sp. NPDC097214]|uniref:hypothetical protein n=1 Tax=Lysinibacillus sp. NPDC097214 TaxID=3390584 RepID=UPI003D018529